MESVDLQPESDVQPAPMMRSRPTIQMNLSDVGTLLLSLVLALVIWLIAVNQENPLIKEQFAEAIPVTIVGLGEGLQPVQDLSKESVTLELRAPRTSWESMKIDDFRAVLDLTGLGPGEHDVAVKVTRRDPQVSVLGVQRPELTVILDRMVEKEVPVQVEIMDGTAYGYDWQAPIYTPVTVTVSGPESQVQQVTKARAEIFLRSAKSQVERTQPLVATDAQNKPIDGVMVAAPGRVQVVVPVEQWPGRKEVAVRVKLSGPPADGYRLSAVRSEPSTVVLQGDPDTLSQVPGYIETEPLDLAGATADVRKRVALILPQGVTADMDFVMATAGISPIEGGITVSEPLIVRGLGAGLSADTALAEVDVILSGPMPLLESLNEDDVFTILDLTGLVQGTHSVVPAVLFPEGIRVDGVIPETVEVVIKAQDTESVDGLPTLPDVKATVTSALTNTTEITATGVVTSAGARGTIPPTGATPLPPTPTPTATPRP